MSAVAENLSELENTPLKKLFWKYTIPTITAMFANGIYTVVDGIFIGNYIGADGLAAMNLLWTVYGLAIGFGIMIGTAASAMFSIEKGRGNPALARQYLANGIALLVFLSIVSSFCFKYLAPVVLSYQLPDSPNVLNAAADYLFVFIIFSVCPLFACAMPMYIRNDERPVLATKLMIVAALVNVIGDYLLIAHFNMGMKGAAAATAFAQSVVMFYGLYYFFSKRSNMRLHLSDFKFSVPLCCKILGLGTSSLVMALYFCIVAIAYNSFFAKYGGPTSIAAYAVAGYVNYFYYLFAEGITGGVQPIISYNFGARKYYNVRRMIGITAKFLVFLYAIFIVVVQGFAPQIAAAFCADDIALLAESIRGLRLMTLGSLFEGLVLLGIVYFQSVDEPRKSALLSIINIFIQIPFMFVLSDLFGLIGLWLVYLCANLPLAVVVLFFMINSFRRTYHRLHEARRIKFSGLQTVEPASQSVPVL